VLATIDTSQKLQLLCTLWREALAWAETPTSDFFTAWDSDVPLMPPDPDVPEAFSVESVSQ
jgi:hypothetical protein